MIRMQYRNLFLFIGIVVSGSVMQADVLDDFNDSDDSLPVIEIGADPIREGECPFASVVVPALDEAGAIEIFKQNVYVGTAPFAVRNVLDWPLWQRPLPQINRWNMGVDIFYNQTNRSVFAPCLPDICGGIGFCNQDLLAAIQNTANNIFDNPAIKDLIYTYLGGSIVNFLEKHSIQEVAALIAPATIQQRRAGALFSITENRDRWTGDIRIPLYWLERNIWLDQADKEKLESFFPKSDSLSEAEIEDFARSHVVSDRYGLGDLRFTLAYQLIDRQNATFHLAGFFTAPTAASFQRGIVGSSFECSPEPELDLCALLNNIPAIKDKIRSLGVAFLDRFSAIFMDDDLGDRKHWGLGGFVEPLVSFNDYMQWHARLFAQYYFSHAQKRYIAKAADINAFNSRDFMSTNLDVAATNLTFLSNRIIEMLFPRHYLVHVKPGSEVMLLNEFLFKWGHWDALLGVDWWHKGAEHIAIPTAADDYLLLVRDASRAGSQQIKLLGGLGYTHRTTTADWVVSLKGDGTVYNKNIGKDWTIALSLGLCW